MRIPVAAATDMTIGQLAGRFGLATHVLRHWEAMGLLAPATRVAGRRRYRPEHVARVATILLGKEAGLSLEDLRRVLHASATAERRVVLERHHAELKHRMSRLQTALTLVEHALDCPSGDFTQCPNFQRLVDAPPPPNSSPRG